MAEFEPIVPGFGTIIDTGEGFEPIIPGAGTYIEQAVAEEIVAVTINYNGLKPMTLSAGRQSQCQVT